MIITKKALPRRTFLRGPRGQRRAAAARRHGPVDDRRSPRRRRRPAAPPRLRLHADGLRPAALDAARRGTGSTSCRPFLQSLAPVEEHVTVISNLELQNAYPGTHATSNASFLSAAQAKLDREHGLLPGHDRRPGRRAADRPADAAAVARTVDGPAADWSASATTATPASIRTTSRGRRRRRRCPAEAHPRIVFERLFGDGGSAADRRAALQRRASLLDSVTDDIDAAAARSSGPADRARVGQYLDTVREVERRIQKAEAERRRRTRCPISTARSGVPAAYADHARLMFDLQVLAFQGDVTRVITFQLARETSNRTYPEIGVPDPHHPLSHHGNDPEKIARMAKINALPRVAVRGVPREAARPRRKATARCSTTRCSSTAAAWAIRTCTTTTTCRSSSPAAPPAGMKGGRHIRFAEPTPLANLHLTLLDKRRRPARLVRRQPGPGRRTAVAVDR